MAVPPLSPRSRAGGLTEWVARTLVLAALDRGVRLGARRIDAMVHPNNEEAIPFWNAVGFDVDVDRRWSLML